MTDVRIQALALRATWTYDFLYGFPNAQKLTVEQRLGRLVADAADVVVERDESSAIAGVHFILSTQGYTSEHCVTASNSALGWLQQAGLEASQLVVSRLMRRYVEGALAGAIAGAAGSGAAGGQPHPVVTLVAGVAGLAVGHFVTQWERVIEYRLDISGEWRVFETQADLVTSTI